MMKSDTVTTMSNIQTVSSQKVTPCRVQVEYAQMSSGCLNRCSQCIMKKILFDTIPRTRHVSYLWQIQTDKIQLLLQRITTLSFFTRFLLPMPLGTTCGTSNRRILCIAMANIASITRIPRIARFPSRTII